MKKKLLTAAVFAALTLSASSVFAAAPTFSGDANIEWSNNNNHSTVVGQNYLTNRIRLNVDSNIDDVFSVHARAKMINDLRNGSEPNINDNGAFGSVTYDQAYIGAKVDNFDIKAGKQSLYSGKGLLMDDDGFSGVKVGTEVEGLKLNGFYGTDFDGLKTNIGEIKTSFNGVNMGANIMDYDGNHYWGVNADTKITDNAVMNVEYVKNTTQSARGYLAGVTMGNYTVSYRDINDGAVDGIHSTNSNYNDSKGFKLGAHYDLSKNSSITLYHDMAKDHAGVQKHRSDVEFDVNF